MIKGPRHRPETATAPNSGWKPEPTGVLPQREPAALTEPAAPFRPTAQRLRILVVEDNRDAAESLRMLLGLMGHDVKVTFSGPDGLAAASSWNPQAVVCDIGLPGLDGYGVARALRQKPATAQVRLIALTGYGSDDDRRRAHEAGFDFHLVKPAAPELLQELLTT